MSHIASAICPRTPAGLYFVGELAGSSSRARGQGARTSWAWHLRMCLGEDEGLGAASTVPTQILLFMLHALASHLAFQIIPRKKCVISNILQYQKSRSHLQRLLFHPAESPGQIYDKLIKKGMAWVNLLKACSWFFLGQHNKKSVFFLVNTRVKCFKCPMQQGWASLNVDFSPNCSMNCIQSLSFW